MHQHDSKAAIIDELGDSVKDAIDKSESLHGDLSSVEFEVADKSKEIETLMSDIEDCDEEKKDLNGKIDCKRLMVTSEECFRDYVEGPVEGADAAFAACEGKVTAYKECLAVRIFL